MRSVEEHRSAALALAAPLPVVAVALDDALGLVLAEPVTAPHALPRWDNSAMDGYAVRADDVRDASPEHPVTLPVVADLPAGTDAEPFVAPGTAARIMTGAPVPPGADAVVPVEHSDGGTTTVTVTRAPADGAHVRRAGEDVHAGDVVLAAGTVLTPPRVAAAASVGRPVLRVHRRPVVAVVSTGSELVEPGEDLGRGRIPDSNSYLLAAAVRAAGAEPLRVGAVPDDPDRLRAVLADLAARTDLVVTSGGVSKGAYDVVKEVLRDEAGMAFVEVAMQPGKPQGLGTLGGTPVLALPGNPVSAYVSFHVLVAPVLRRLAGRSADDAVPDPVPAVADAGWRTPRARAQYMPVLVADGGPAPRVRPAARGGSGSHLVAGLAAAQGLAVVPADVEEVRPGDVVGLLRSDPGGWGP